MKFNFNCIPELESYQINFVNFFNPLIFEKYSNCGRNNSRNKINYTLELYIKVSYKMRVLQKQITLGLNYFNVIDMFANLSQVIFSKHIQGVPKQT